MSSAPGPKVFGKSWHSPLIQSDRYLLVVAMSTDTGNPVNLFFSVPKSILVVMVFYWDGSFWCFLQKKQNFCPMIIQSGLSGQCRRKSREHLLMIRLNGFDNFITVTKNMRTEKTRNAYWHNSKFPGENQVNDDPSISTYDEHWWHWKTCRASVLTNREYVTCATSQEGYYYKCKNKIFKESICSSNLVPGCAHEQPDA